MANNKDFIVKNAVEVGGSVKTTVGTVTSGDAGYTLSGASYDSVSFSVATEETTPAGISFKPDGTKMYIVGWGNDGAYQYTLSTAWDISTASYDSVSLDLSTQDTTPLGGIVSNSGNNLYVVGNDNDTIYQYNLSTAYDLSTASYASKSFDLSSQDTTPASVAFKTDGTKMYICGNTGDSIYQYSLSTAWDVSTASYDSVSFSVSSQESLPNGVTFNDEGTLMFMVGTGNDTIYQYSLSTAWDLSTASYDSISLDVSSEDIAPRHVAFKTNGGKLFLVANGGDSVYQYSVGDFTRSVVDLDTGNYFSDTLAANTTYTLSNAGDVQAFQLEVTGGLGDGNDLSATFFEKTLDVSSQDTAPTDLFIADNGTKLYLVGEQTDDIYQYNLSTAWDVSTAVSQASYAIPSGNGTNPTGIFVKPDGTKLYVSMENTEDITQYSMSTAFDLSTISDDGVVYTIPSGAGSITRSVFFKPDGTKLYTTIDSTGMVYQHSLSTAWDISTASYDSVSFTADPDNTYNNLKGLSVDSTGTNFYLLDRDYDEVFKYTLTTAWDISTASFAQRVDISGKETTGEGIFVKPDGSKMYITGTASDSVHQYSIAPTNTLTWPSSIEWAGGVAPAAPANGETDLFTFATDDGGTTYTGVKTADNLS